MTRKDYERIASVFAETKKRQITPGASEEFRDGFFTAWAHTMVGIAKVLEADNPRFDRERFVKACE